MEEHQLEAEIQLAACVFVNSAKLRCEVPAVSGTVDFTVRNPNGQEGTLANGFAYL